MNNLLRAAAIIAAPQAVSACGTAACAHPGGWGVSTALMGAVSALGFWVLKQAGKDKNAVGIAGRVTGWTLLVVGLLGFLCGSSYHILKPNSCQTQPVTHSESMSMILDTLPPGHPPLDQKTEKGK